ncbi:MAG: putative GNAT family N-acyltransferase [Gammaproteobacteria bacterium]|jgi:predicted GNAT family N-acyltransferase
MSNNSFKIIQANWEQDGDRIMMIRKVVFVEEQKVSLDEEIDNLDEQCRFVLAVNDDGDAIGTGRLLPTGKIGRLAVLKDFRKLGVGSELLKSLIDIAKTQSIPNIYLHGQTHAKIFYNKHGFIEEGEIFDEAGIPHFKMRLNRQY